MPELLAREPVSSETQGQPLEGSTVEDAISRSTTTLLRIGFSIGLASNVAASIPPLLAEESAATSILAVAWCLPWIFGAAKPAQAGRIVADHVWSVVVLGALLVGLSVVASGGFGSYLKTSVNWLPWIIAVLFRARVVALSATVISFGLAVSMAVASGIGLMFSEANRYTTVSDLLNPWIIGLVAISLAGVFRSTFRDVATTITAFRNGDWSTSGLRLSPSAERKQLPRSISADKPPKSSILTPTEQEMVDLLASGLSPKQIAFSTHRTLDTVYEHIANAKRKYDTDSIAGLVAIAWKPT